MIDEIIEYLEEALEGVWSGKSRNVLEMITHLETIKTERAKMVEALKFYGKKAHYTELHSYKGLHNCELIGQSPLSDQGDIARKVLEEIKGK